MIWIRFVLPFGDKRQVVWPAVPRVGEMVLLVDDENPRPVEEVVFMESDSLDGASLPIFSHVLIRLGDPS